MRRLSTGHLRLPARPLLKKGSLRQQLKQLVHVIIIESNNSVSGRTVSQHLRDADYVRFRRTGVNDWYARTTDTELGTVVRRALYYPSRALAQSKIAALAFKLRVRKLPGVLPVWYLGKRLLGGTRNA